MGKRIIVTALAVFTFGFGSALRSNAGTETVEPYRAPAPAYNYAPPRPVFFAPPPVVGVFVGRSYGYYGRGYGYYGRGYGYYHGRRFYGGHGYGRGYRRHWH